MIILEGPDNSGKSTLAEFLASGTGIKANHSGGPIKSKADYQMRVATFFSTEKVYVMDRWPSISEQVYGSVMGRSYDIEFDETTIHALARGWLFIYCRPPLDHLMDFTKHRGSEYTAPGVTPEAYHRKIEEKQHHLVERYDEVMSHVPHIRYDFKSATPKFLSFLQASCRRFIK